jgi:threonyl-tRNA synthetase
MTYIEEDGQAYRPYMIHRALLGSIERFFGVLVEHYGGAFPVWLSPVQAKIIPIADRHVAYAKEVAEALRKSGLRVEVDDRSDRMNAKIRDAEKEKVPYMLVVGDREMEDGKVDIRRRSGERLGAMEVQAFRDFAVNEVAEKVAG